MESRKNESNESEPRSVVVFKSGREAGINWVRGFVIDVDPSTGKILSVRPADHEWTDRDLQKDALQMDSTESEDAPQVGDLAPAGWQEWRK